MPPHDEGSGLSALQEQALLFLFRVANRNAAASQKPDESKWDKKLNVYFPVTGAFWEKFEKWRAVGIASEKAGLELMALRLLCAVAQPHIYSETVVIAACAGGEFTAKGKTVKHPGWKALEDAYRAKMKYAEPKKEGAEKALPELTEGQTLSVAAAIVKEGKSSPPQHFTEDTLLSAMETAGKEDMPEDAERKGLGTPATRAGILEKLVSAGFLERKKSRKTVQLLPSHDAVSLITVLPEQLQSPLCCPSMPHRPCQIACLR